MGEAARRAVRRGGHPNISFKLLINVKRCMDSNYVTGRVRVSSVKGSNFRNTHVSDLGYFCYVALK